MFSNQMSDVRCQMQVWHYATCGQIETVHPGCGLKLTPGSIHPTRKSGYKSQIRIMIKNPGYAIEMLVQSEKIVNTHARKMHAARLSFGVEQLL